MSIISLIQELLNNFNSILSLESLLYLEPAMINYGDDMILKIYGAYLSAIDLEYKKSIERFEKYIVKETKEVSKLTYLGWVTYNETRYIDRETKKSFVYLRNVLGMIPYQRMTEYAEYKLINYAKENNMSQAARNALRGNIVSRSLVSKKMAKLNGAQHEEIKRKSDTPEVLYIEMDEIHANLQDKNSNGKSKNHICPCAIVHEGHVDELSKRNVLKNARHFASATLNYRQLWDVIYDYVDKRYDIDKIKFLFVSGDGASGIKDYKDVLPNAIYVFDKFHYRRDLAYLFKTDKDLISLADDYLRNDRKDDFKTLVKAQIQLYPKSEKYMLDKQNLLINNIHGIKNQKHEFYKCPCAMEGHVSNQYARYITSSPFAFSLTGLENKLKLLVMQANKIELTYDGYLEMKYKENEYIQIVNNMKKITNKNVKLKLIKNEIKDYNKSYKLIKTIDPLINNIINNLLSFNNAKTI